MLGIVIFIITLFKFGKLITVILKWIKTEATH